MQLNKEHQLVSHYRFKKYQNLKIHIILLKNTN